MEGGFPYLLENTLLNTYWFFSSQARCDPCQTEWIHSLGTGQSQTVILTVTTYLGLVIVIMRGDGEAKENIDQRKSFKNP